MVGLSDVRGAARLLEPPSAAATLGTTLSQPHYFVSYSRADAADFAVTLADKLQAGPPPYRAWVDTRELQPGRQDWDDQIATAIQECAGLLFVMSVDSIRVGSGCKPEWVTALRYKKPVIP